MSQITPSAPLGNVSKAIQVNPLALSGSGSNTDAGRAMIDQNKVVTMQLAQLSADAVYDPKVPSSGTTPQFIQPFIGSSTQASIGISIAVCGILAVIYGILG